MALIFSFTSQPAAASDVLKALADEPGGQVLGLQFPALDLSARVHLRVLLTFRQLAAAIEQAGVQNGPEQLRQAIAIVDTASINNLDELDPLSTTGDPYATVVALLVLAFPEIHWMFVGASNNDDQPDFVKAHLLKRDATVDRVIRLRRQDLSRSLIRQVYASVSVRASGTPPRTAHGSPPTCRRARPSPSPLMRSRITPSSTPTRPSTARR